MVSLWVSASCATGGPDRETADAGFGVPFEVASDGRLAPALAHHRYP